MLVGGSGLLEGVHGVDDGVNVVLGQGLVHFLKRLPVAHGNAMNVHLTENDVHQVQLGGLTLQEAHHGHLPLGPRRLDGLVEAVAADNFQHLV
jgi:alanine dehydrogenase